MRKTDKSIHNICIAAIKRSTFKPYDFKWTKFYESNADFAKPALINDLADDELIICSAIIDEDNYSILTTTRMLTKEKGQLGVADLGGAKDMQYGDFKGYKDKDYTLGKIELKGGDDFSYFIETGNASMVMIHAVKTLLRITEMTNDRVDKVTRIWNKQNNNPE